MLTIKQLAASDVQRIGDVDRREKVSLKFVQEDGKLISESVDWNIPRWKTDDSPFSTQVRIEKWRPIVEQGGAIFGALDEDDSLCGFVIVNPDSFEGVPEITALFISRDYRRQGIGAQLMFAAEAWLASAKMENVFVTSNNSEAAVRFYLKQGYELVVHHHPALYKALYEIDPEGIHLYKTLA